MITNGGGAPNVVPDDAEVWYFIRAPRRDLLEEITARVRKIARGAAMMSGDEAGGARHPRAAQLPAQ